jgi:hypothetical protein
MSGEHNASPGTETGDGDPEGLPVVCPHCFTRNSLRQHFCRRCGTPLTGLAVTDPLGQVYSEGDALRKAMDKPDRPIKLIGVWLIWGPTFLGCVGLVVWFIVGAFTDPFGQVNGEIILAALFPLGVVAVGLFSGLVLFKTTRNFIRLRRARQPDDHAHIRGGETK